MLFLFLNVVDFWVSENYSYVPSRHHNFYSFSCYEKLHCQSMQTYNIWSKISNIYSPTYFCCSSSSLSFVGLTRCLVVSPLTAFYESLSRNGPLYKDSKIRNSVFSRVTTTQFQPKAAANFAIILPLFLLSILKQVSFYFYAPFATCS